MSMTGDMTLIRQQFLAHWDKAAHPVYFDLSGQQPDTTKLYTMFVIRPGASERQSFGTSGVMKQIGRVWMTVVVPATGTFSEGMAVAEAFALIFRNWRSADNCITFDTEDYNTYPQKDGTLQITVSIPYTSIR